MGDWVPIDQWPECARMERPGIVFEVRNRDGQSLVTPCVVPLPETPFDWTAPARRIPRGSRASRRSIPHPIPQPAEQP